MGSSGLALYTRVTTEQWVAKACTLCRVFEITRGNDLFLNMVKSMVVTGPEKRSSMAAILSLLSQINITEFGRQKSYRYTAPLGLPYYLPNTRPWWLRTVPLVHVSNGVVVGL